MNYKSKVQNKNIAWYLPRPNKSKYKGGMPLYCEDWLMQLGFDILDIKSGSILNVFCGMGKRGLRVDINPEVQPKILCDVHKLTEYLDPKTHNYVDIILADPPYSNEEAKKLYGINIKLNYKKWTSECDKYLKIGGLFIIYHKYIVPNPNPQKYEIIKRVFIGNRIWHLSRVAIYFKKIKD